MLKDMSVKDFILETSSNSPAPGGGSIAALEAASAAALIEMVTRLTIGKKGYEDKENEMLEIQDQAKKIKEDLIDLIDKDASSFDKVIAGFKMPKTTDEEKELRTQAIQKGYKEAATVPLTVGKKAYELMDLAKKVVINGNSNAITDGAVAAMSARTAILSAFYNVKINLGSIKDENFVNDLKEEMKKIEENVQREEKDILSNVNL